MPSRTEISTHDPNAAARDLALRSRAVLVAIDASRMQPSRATVEEMMAVLQPVSGEDCMAALTLVLRERVEPGWLPSAALWEAAMRVARDRRERTVTDTAPTEIDPAAVEAAKEATRRILADIGRMAPTPNPIDAQAAAREQLRALGEVNDAEAT